MRSASSREIACSPLLRAHGDRAGEGRVRDDLDVRSRHEPELGEVAEELRVAVRHARDRAALAGLEVDERPVAPRPRRRSSRSGIGSPCGSWVGKPSSASIFASSSSESACSRQVCLGVHLVEREPEPVDEVALEQAVVAKHLERAAASLLGQRDSAVRRALDEPELGEALRHRGRRRCADAHPRGERGRRHALARGLEGVDRLQVVLDGDGQVGGLGTHLGCLRLHCDSDLAMTKNASHPSQAARRSRAARGGAARRQARARRARRRPAATTTASHVHPGDDAAHVTGGRGPAMGHAAMIGDEVPAVGGPRRPRRAPLPAAGAALPAPGACASTPSPPSTPTSRSRRASSSPRGRTTAPPRGR